MTTAEQRGQQRPALLIETICATGIRVSEPPYITVGKPGAILDPGGNTTRAEVATMIQRFVTLVLTQHF